MKCNEHYFANFVVENCMYVLVCVCECVLCGSITVCVLMFVCVSMRVCVSVCLSVSV